MRKTGRENGRKNDQRRSGNESSRGKLGDIFEKGKMREWRKKTVKEELGEGKDEEGGG